VHYFDVQGQEFGSGYGFGAKLWQAFELSARYLHT